MNYLMVAQMLGTILHITAAFLAPALLISAFCGERAAVFAFAVTIAVAVALGFLLRIRKPRRQTLYAREGFAVTGLAWIVVSLVGALPFYLSGAVPSFVDCLFETVSGFTTTGASILRDVEALPYGLLYWRSFTHWVGGMGVLVFMLAILPAAKGNGETLHIMRAESPGPQVGKLTPRTGQSARILYAIYIAMTLFQIILLLAGGMSLFEAVTTAFGTAGTGGFGVRNDSMVSFSPYIQWVTAIFMALFGVNFSIYYMLLLRDLRGVAKNEELRWYVIIMLGAAAMIFLSILPTCGSAAQAIRDAFFQVSSVMTTTGFATANFDLWPQIARALLLVLMIVGASAGSTGGGVKVARIVILFKSLGLRMRQMLNPNTVNVVRLDGETLPASTVSGMNAYFGVYFFIAVGSTLLISLDGFSLETNLSAEMACLNNIGPGLGAVGPMGNYAGFSNASKIVLSVNMLVGRLEIFPMIMLLMPSMWKRARSMA